MISVIKPSTKMVTPTSVSLANVCTAMPRSVAAHNNSGSILARFGEDQRGTTAIIFALMIAPVMMLTGMAVDFSRMVTVKARMQTAVDAAALAGAKAAQVSGSSASLATLATTAAANYYNAIPMPFVLTNGKTLTPSINTGSTVFTWTATSWVKTPFLSIAALIQNRAKDPAAPADCAGGWWVCQKVVTAATTVLQSGGTNTGYSIETSLIVDLSGSMAQSDGSGSTKILSLKSAAQDLVNILVWADQSVYTSRVAIVPYSMGVNVGSLANQVRGTLASGTSTTPGSQNYTFTGATGYSVTQASSNCVSERIGANAYTDAAPNNSATAMAASAMTAPVGRNYPDPNNPCLTNAIVPLSNNSSTLATAITALAASGSTAGQVGIAWGWYMLSPNFNYLLPTANQSASYGDLTVLTDKGVPKLKKIAVLMTDGDYNTTYCNGVIGADSGSGSGNTATHINCNAPNGTAYNQGLAQCTAMKAKGIEIYTVGFLVVDSQPARDLLSQCATDASHYYVATSGDALRQQFRDIALKISYLRITG